VGVAPGEVAPLVHVTAGDPAQVDMRKHLELLGSKASPEFITSELRPIDSWSPHRERRFNSLIVRNSGDG
jgi:hypothetical protein